ncbi:MAG: YlxR family protein [Candidatus Melainabacteria bacterium]|nr:YlxR family protein [Candidatus Melainabacteria bacterium]MBI3309521.1 YlxR family protein [Candidatus Melainabacteria bacterium]
MINQKEKIRQCISCRLQFPRRNLLRITRVLEYDNGKLKAKIVINPNKHQFGRSVYLCKNPACITAAIKNKKIPKMLRTSNSLLDDNCLTDIENATKKEVIVDGINQT